MKKIGAITLALVLILSIAAFGYAAWSDTLTVNGDVAAEGEFNLEFIAASVDTTNAIGVSGTPTATYTAKTATADVKLGHPGAGVEVEYQIENKGTVDAVLNLATLTQPTTSFLSIAVDSDLSSTTANILAPGEVLTFSVVITWDVGDSTQVDTEITDGFTISLNYDADTQVFSAFPSFSIA